MPLVASQMQRSVLEKSSKTPRISNAYRSDIHAVLTFWQSTECSCERFVTSDFIQCCENETLCARPSTHAVGISTRRYWPLTPAQERVRCPYASSCKHDNSISQKAHQPVAACRACAVPCHRTYAPTRSMHQMREAVSRYSRLASIKHQALRRPCSHVRRPYRERDATVRSPTPAPVGTQMLLSLAPAGLPEPSLPAP